MIRLFRYLRTIHSLPGPLRDRLEDKLQEKELAGKGYLLKQGQTCRHIYFVAKGLVRSYYNQGGKEISSGFMKEDEICVSWDSFFTQQYGQENLQAIEDSILYYLSYEEVQRIYQDFPEVNIITRIIMERCLLARQQRLQAMWMQRAEDRYRWLADQSPELLQRVPAKYLASYIGITEGMLSKIKSNSAKRIQSS